MTLFKSASIITAFTLLSRITGLVREQLMATMFGASSMTDAFNVAFRLPNMFRRLFAEGAFSQAFVPVLGQSKVNDGDAATHQLVNRVATVLFVVLVVTCIIGVVAAPVLVWIMASGLKQDPRGYEAGVLMARWMFPYIGFMSLVALGAGVLNTYKKFAIPAFTPVLLNVCMITAAWLGAPWFKTMGIEPIYAMTAGVMLGGLLQLGMQIYALSQLGMTPQLNLSPSGIKTAWADAGVRRVATLMLPALLGVSVAHISAIINLQIASHLQAGSISWMGYAERFMEFPTALLGVALGVVLTPRLVAAKASGDTAEYSAMIDWGLRLVVLLAVPCTVALLLFAKPLVATLYHYGVFSNHDVTQVTTPLMGYAVGLIGLIAIKILAPGFYASQDMKTPVKIAIAVLVITQLLNLVLVPLFAHAGLALSIGLGALINALWLLIGLMRRGSYQPVAGWGKYFAQVFFASCLLAAFLWWANQVVDWTALRSDILMRIVLLAGVIIASVAIYFIAVMGTGLKVKALIKRQ
ncbi:MAG: murein biosynthesis integral membrane protein MurJ [Polaromonas sp.]|nr:murein biosynthesis integral membrane protein MurJ [Polaromonas sp.]